jgi:CDP-glucose 4,6-dehydratase
MPFNDFYRGRSVLVTGHTGFKGSWLCEWLLRLGACVTGLALDPQADDTFYNQLGLGERIRRDIRGDARDFETVWNAISEAKPDIIFHLAAQPLVRYSYADPLGTFATNVSGTLNLLEAIRKFDRECAAVFVTTDKCYENREWIYAYREVDSLGGHDPYSASKACAEKSFFSCGRQRVVTARAGNVIGGGDWAPDRVVPDCMRSYYSDRKMLIRNPLSTRPWQHVLEPLSGYLWLGVRISMLEGREDFDPYIATGFNFGPHVQSNRSVEELVFEINKHVKLDWDKSVEVAKVHEASRLSLSIDKAFHLLRWSPVWDFEKTVEETVNWYQVVKNRGSVLGVTQSQIEDYCHDAAIVSNRWAIGQALIS